MMTVGHPPNTWFGFIRIRGDNISDTLAIVESTWRNMYTTIPFEYSFLDENYNNFYKAEERLGNIFGAFALLSIFVTCLGLFGLASFMAEQRIREIGIRKVLGASLANIVVIMTRDFTKLVVVAVVMATPLAYIAMDRWLQDFAYHIDMGPWIYLLAGITALLIAWATVGFQALKAALSNPVDTLRSE
jgi:putative ABC transport system permease protein